MPAGAQPFDFTAPSVRGLSPMSQPGTPLQRQQSLHQTHPQSARHHHGVRGAASRGGAGASHAAAAAAERHSARSWTSRRYISRAVDATASSGAPSPASVSGRHTPTSSAAAGCGGVAACVGPFMSTTPFSTPQVRPQSAPSDASSAALTPVMPPAMSMSLELEASSAPWPSFMLTTQQPVQQQRRRHDSLFVSAELPASAPSSGEASPMSCVTPNNTPVSFFGGPAIWPACGNEVAAAAAAMALPPPQKEQRQEQEEAATMPPLAVPAPGEYVSPLARYAIEGARRRAAATQPAASNAAAN